ncbi:MAG: ABC transporter ATP-binding protein [Alphaproteobacteria bacterium]
MDRSIYRFVLRYSKREQIMLILLAGVSYPFLYYSYDLPKQIINHIRAVVENQSQGVLTAYPDAALPLVDLQFTALGWLVLLCMVFLALTLINGGFKFYINVFKGQLAERMLRRLRYELYARVLRFPLAHFKKVSQGEIIPMITSEVEPLGGFIGDAYVQPIFQGGLLLVPLGFILAQDPVLGIAALAMFPVQGYIIPKIQRVANRLGKERVLTVRKLGDRIGESIAGIDTLRASDATAFARADMASRLGVIYDLRFHIYRLKGWQKYINNSLDKITPFFFYLLGGWLVFAGDLDLGALVAVIAAQKDLAAPWKELLTYYQQKEDTRIKYEQVIEQFDPAGMLDPNLLDPDAAAEPLSGEVAAANLTYAEDGSDPAVAGANFRFPLKTHVAVLGSGRSGREEVAMLLAGLLRSTGGRLTIGGRDVAEMPAAVLGRRIGYVGPQATLFSASLGDNLFLGLKHRPVRPRDLMRDAAADDARLKHESERRRHEALRAGNTGDDPDDDWLDLESVGVADGDGLLARAHEVLEHVEMAGDVYQLGLRGTIDPTRHPALADAILEARRRLHHRLEDAGKARFVEAYDRSTYNTNATVAENLLFGTPRDSRFDAARLAENDYVRQVLTSAGLDQTFFDTGLQVAETMVEIFADLPPGHEFFDQFGFFDSDDLPDYQRIVAEAGRSGGASLTDADHQRLVGLTFMLSPARHRLGLIDDQMQDRILQARRLFSDDLPAALRDAVAFFDVEQYNAAATLQDNILFGKLAYGQADAEAQVSALMGEVVDALNLRGRVMEVGLTYQVGVGGSRLSRVQRQKLAIAQALLKRPDLLVLNEATGVLDSATETRLADALQTEMAGRGLVWVLTRPALVERFDRVLVMHRGRVVEDGEVKALADGQSRLKKILAAE